MSTLSHEQMLKLEERLDWLRHDAVFDEYLSTQLREDVALGDTFNQLPEKVQQRIEAGVRNISFKVVEAALQRFEQEKVLITGKGRYVKQVDELLSNTDAFFENYPREVKQIGVSVFRFAHRLLSDHLGEEKGYRTFALKQQDVVAALEKLFAKLHEVVSGA